MCRLLATTRIFKKRAVHEAQTIFKALGSCTMESLSMMIVSVDRPSFRTVWTEEPILQGRLQPPRVATRTLLIKHITGTIHRVPTTALASENERRVILAHTPQWMIWQMPQSQEAVLPVHSTADRPPLTSTAIALRTMLALLRESNQTEFHSQLGSLKNPGLKQVNSIQRNRRRQSFCSISQPMSTNRLQRSTINIKVLPPCEDLL